MSCLPDDIIESVISCEIAKATWTDLVYSFKGPSDTKENRIIDLKLEYQNFRAKPTESLSQTYTRYKTLLNELANDGVNLSIHAINVGFMNSLPKKWLTFSQGLRNANHTQTLDLADIYGRFVYEDNLIQRRYPDTKKALITTPSTTAISIAFFSNNVIHDFQENSDDEVDERSNEEYLKDLDIEFHKRALLVNLKRHFAKDCLSKTSEPSYKSPVTGYSLVSKGLVAETFDWDEEEVSDDEEVTKVKVLMSLADDELSVGKNHARNGEWIDIIMRKVNILLSMDEDADWQNYLKYINIDLKFVEEKRLNLLSKYNKIVFELDKCRDELLILKQYKLDAVTFQIQNTELTKLIHALQEQLKEEKKINEKWLTSSKKVSQCISEQIPYQKKTFLGGELLTESLSKINLNENIFIPAYMHFDHEMVPKSKDWVKRLNPDIRLSNFNTGRILVPESQAINKSLKPTEASTVPESSKDSKAESFTPLPPLKILQGASPISETKSSKLVDSSKMSQDSKPKVQNSGSSKSLRPKPIQNPQLKCELYHYTNHSTDDCYRILYYMICKREDHRTNHEMYNTLLKRSENYNAQPYHYDHFTSGHNRVIHIRGGVLAEFSQSSKSLIGVKCNTYGSIRHIREPIWYLDSGCSRSMTGVKCYLHKYVEQPGPKVVFGDNSYCITEGYGSINCGGITFTKVAFVNGLKYNLISISQLCDAKYIVQFDDKQGTIFNANKEIVLIAPRRNDVYVLDMSSLTPNGACFFAKALEKKHVPKVIAPNELDIPHTKDAKGPPDLINTKGTHEQIFQDEQIITQSTEGPSGQNTKVLVSIIESLVPNVPQSHISNQASTSSHLVTQGMLTRSMAAKLTAASASECLFADFLSEIEPKKSKKDEHGITTKNKERLVAQGYSQEEGNDYDETFAPVPTGFESSEFPDYVCKLDKALYGLKQDPRAWCVKGTLSLGLYYPKCSGFDLKGYSDSDYAGCNMDRKNTSVPIFCDNASAIAISNNPVLHSRTKHIDIRYHFIRDYILKGDIKLHFILIEYQLADIFTKPLNEPTFTRLKAELGMLNID
ncbi:retrovirus-related pol polyprotein from transposon TNT 1-94 [Tanacetum coccineum]